MPSTAYAGFDRQSLPAPRVNAESFRKCEEARLLEEVQAALRNCGHGGLRELEVEVANGVVLLWGQVTSFYQKQLAQVVAQRVNGVRGVANGLEVICRRTDHHGHRI